jgi:hypothetical protein
MTSKSQEKLLVELANARVPHELPAIAERAVFMGGAVPPEVNALLGPAVPLAMAAPEVPAEAGKTPLPPTPAGAPFQPERTETP